MVAVGSNLSFKGNPPISVVCEALTQLVNVAQHTPVFSHLYQTPAFPPGSGPDYVNAAIALDWPGSAATLMQELHILEQGFGRIRRRRWEARALDLDLIAFGDTVLPDPETQTRWRDLPPVRAAEIAPETLILPHPRLAERAFVLRPLADIAPDWTHPLTGHSVTEMLAALPEEDRAAMRIVNPPSGALPFPPSGLK
ncbi:2-amino-4-hydroxy-6-hydroxymethyldihydropteridine diphosphokinase [Rhodophyticola sp. CCM32]|nr:2-amino-4-hydroxy-6-hydroxymethyldihydropteridine diphosphokinase [Rhodophyticola sp. CCM32]